MTLLRIRRAEVDGRLVDVDVDTRAGVVTAVEPHTVGRGRGRGRGRGGGGGRGRGGGGGGATAIGGDELDARGGALIPGLHDHHVHLAATAAAWSSVDLSPSAVVDATAMADALGDRMASLADGDWLRATGYHEAVAGDLDRVVLDAMAPAVPLRVQHRSGAAWFVNTPGLRALGLLEGADRPAGVEVGPDGTPTGRLFRMDDWLRDRIGTASVDLGPVSAALASYGVTGCSDATPWPTLADVDRFRAALRASVSQQVRWMSAPGVHGGAATKIVLGDHELPSLVALERWIAGSHDAGLPVAVHAVTAVALAMAIAAWSEVGVLPGDRIEHAAVVPPAALAVLAELGVCVVTQPGMVATRGDSYLADVEPQEVADLWRCGSLIDAGVPVAAGSDAPYGPLDPWLAIETAVTRRTSTGAMLGEAERLAPRRSLELWLGPLGSPGALPRRVEPGAPADLCLLDDALDDVLGSPSAERVVATILRGVVIHHR